MILIALFAFVPSGLLLTVGVLILVLGHATRDMIFGIMTLGLTCTLLGGVVATVVYVRRESSVAQLQTEFVNKVSHDLRTPLTSIRLFVETLQSGRLRDPDKIQQALDTIATETARLSAMIDRLLGWARMEAGKRTYHPETADPCRIVDDALRAFQPQLLTADAKIEVQVHRHVQEDLPKVFVDSAAMSEALLNLLQNAFKYTGPEKRIALRAVRDGGEVVFEVEDNGVGIARREQKRIFDRFYRVDSLLTRVTEGSGLGLSIAQRIAAAHGGRISVDSTVGKGSTFRIHLPA